MTIASNIKKYISTIPDGQTFSSNSLRHFATTENIRQILNRLVKAGEIKRVARGVFVKPKQLSTIGEVLPPTTEVAKILAKTTDETITVQGAEAARLLQLSTQVPMQLILYTNGNTRTLNIMNRKIKLKHVNPSRLVAAGTTPGLVINALFYLGRENVTTKTIEMIKHRISEKEFIETIKLMENMPAWMADIFYRHQERKK